MVKVEVIGETLAEERLTFNGRELAVLSEMALSWGAGVGLLTVKFLADRITAGPMPAQCVTDEDWVLDGTSKHWFHVEIPGDPKAQFSGNLALYIDGQQVDCAQLRWEADAKEFPVLTVTMYVKSEDPKRLTEFVRRAGEKR